MIISFMKGENTIKHLNKNFRIGKTGIRSVCVNNIGLEIKTDMSLEVTLFHFPFVCPKQSYVNCSEPHFSYLENGGGVHLLHKISVNIKLKYIAYVVSNYCNAF